MTSNWDTRGSIGMNDQLKARCKRFVSTEKTLHKVFPLQMPYVYPLCALLFLEAGKEPESRKLRECDKLFAKKSGLSFDFSGTSTLMVISQMSMTKEPEELLEKIQRAKKVLKKEFPLAMEAIPLAAVLLSQEEEAEWETISERAKEIFANITKHNRILTTGGDIIFALLLAIHDKDAIAVLDEAEACYQYLKTAMPMTEPVTLSRVLAFGRGDTLEEKCDRFLNLYNKLKEQGQPYGKQYQLPMLGLASLLPEDAEDVLKDIMEVDNYLSRQDLYRGLLNWYSRTVRLMHAAMIVASSGQDDLDDTDAAKYAQNAVYARNAALAMQISVWSLFYLLFV